MKVIEYGQENQKTLAMFQCALEPGWAFEASAGKLAGDFHVFLFVADGHDETGTDFISVEKNAEDAAAYLRDRGMEQLDLLYGVSMGGAGAMYFLAKELMPVKKAIVDAGITPYPYPRWICRIIALKDLVTMWLGTKSLAIMKMAMPPEKWTPKGEDPEEHYEKIFEFTKNHLSARTIYNVFWSANNYSMPDVMPEVETEMEYWYGEKEKKARKNNIAYAKKTFPHMKVKEFAGLEHAELVMMEPERFHEEVMRVWSGGEQEDRA